MNGDKFRFYALWLCAVCVIVFILQTIFPSITDMFFLNQDYFQIWRFVSAIFLHASLIHLVYNLFALALFGSILERLVGGKRFLLVFFSSGIIANIISALFYPSSLGASGAIFGVIGALVIVRPGMTVWAFSLPMPLFLAALLWVGGDILGAYGYLAGNPIDNTGNIAHLAGILIGFIFGAVYRRQIYRKERISGNQISKHEKVKINEEDVRAWENYYMR